MFMVNVIELNQRIYPTEVVGRLWFGATKGIGASPSQHNLEPQE